MINSADKYQVSDIFDVEKLIEYHVPKFQREYIWGKDQWDALFNDIYENESGHFLGSIITINKGTDALKIVPLELIDGQQRLATLSLLYAAIYKRYEEEGRDDSDHITDKTNIKNKLVHKKYPKQLRLELQAQNYNNDDYEVILGESGLIDQKAKKPKNFGNRRLIKAYRTFYSKIENMAYSEVEELLDKVNAVLLVKIEVDNHSDAFLLFESLNNRGVPLSAIDIIKNNLLARLEKKRLLELDEAFEQWTEMVDNLPEPSIQERFLRQYYNAYKFKSKIKLKKYPRATRGNLIKIYDSLIKKDPKYIFNELYEKSKVYYQFVEPETDSSHYNGLINLLRLGAAPGYAFLLYLFSRHKRKQNLIADSIDLLIKFFVRRHLTDFPATRDLDALFIDLIKHCEKVGYLNYNYIKKYFLENNKIASISEFKDALSGNIYTDNTVVTRFVLCTLELSNSTKETFTGLWERDRSKKYIWTIEHIFPEGKNIPKEWAKMIAGGDMEKAQEYQENYVHKLGNLTLTGFNPNLSNLGFVKKRDRKNTAGKNIGYKNGLWLNRKVFRKNKWTIPDIEERTEFLVKEAMKIFKFKGEKLP